MEEADYFLQRTFYNEPPELVQDFAEVRYGCGYGLILKKERNKIEHLLNNTNWNHYSNLAVHNCRHISMYHIRQAIVDGGFIDACATFKLTKKPSELRPITEFTDKINEIAKSLA